MKTRAFTLRLFTLQHGFTKEMMYAQEPFLPALTIELELFQVSNIQYVNKKMALLLFEVHAEVTLKSYNTKYIFPSFSVRERTVKIIKGTGEYPWGFRIQFSKPIVVTEVDTSK